jgi:hypothetical protein
MLLLNWFWPYGDSWHVAVDSDKKRTMYGIGRYCLALHDVVVHDMAVHDVGVPGVKMLRNISSKK